MRQLNVELIQVDFSDLSDQEVVAKELERTDRDLLPVNVFYPPNYPEEPAILLDALFSPSAVMKILDRMEKIQSQLPAGTAP